MKIDLHTHGKLSKKSAFSEDYFREMVTEALANGLQALALTEHFNTSNFFGMYETLDRMYPYNGHYYEADGLMIFPGMEVDIAETGHILLIGLKEDILEARYALEGIPVKADLFRSVSCWIWPTNAACGKSVPTRSAPQHRCIIWTRSCWPGWTLLTSMPRIFTCRASSLTGI